MDIAPERLFRLLADTTRLQSVLLLHSEGRLCVCELTHALEQSQPKISRHLAQLRDAGLVVDERRGQWVHYRLVDDLPGWVHQVIEAAATQRSWRVAQQRLGCMPNRPPLE
ncbi:MULTISPECIES: metalloregulator ArsR/SmtB family transcription factor [unclassified Halorhodospira]|uniref:metalloregulator ArsR/SmtB family transcription factor n=1 Tax=unclassified Halorhodospira TaxID=2626748 RepID=UPI001EE84D37|nr:MULTISPECIES: metalloregulator ArsR/SmtB family transcription factor [unclassified Halorhodospira]MCG5542012.1 metalloregulator ArsR/SmtB family transcription factor [Halorhodospira sp. M39old]MCG5545790.1 metalloregulator ArsR/SmtB family transcription factor [Halorhodospira sp. M38]